MLHTLVAISFAASSLILYLPQQTSTSARTAGLRFALANGLKVDSNRVVVIAESHYMSPHGPVSRTSAEEKRLEAESMASVLGSSVQVAEASSVLACVRYNCAAKGQQTVIEVTEPEKADDSGRFDVLVKVIEPPSSKYPKAVRGTLTLPVRS
jgi:hypothetical protein